MSTPEDTTADKITSRLARLAEIQSAMNDLYLADSIVGTTVPMNLLIREQAEIETELRKLRRG